MKVTRFPLFVFSIVSSLALLTTISCKKSNSGSSGNGISATVSGTAVTPTTTAAVYSTAAGFWEITGYSIKSGDTAIIDMGIYKLFPNPINYWQFIVNKPFTTDTTSAYVDYYANGLAGKIYDASDGNGHATLTVTSLDTVNNKIAGTFSGVLYNYSNSNDSIAVTNGKFSTAYTVQ